MRESAIYGRMRFNGPTSSAPVVVIVLPSMSLCGWKDRLVALEELVNHAGARMAIKHLKPQFPRLNFLNG